MPYTWNGSSFVCFRRGRLAWIATRGEDRTFPASGDYVPLSRLGDATARTPPHRYISPTLATASLHVVSVINLAIRARLHRGDTAVPRCGPTPFTFTDFRSLTITFTQADKPVIPRYKRTRLACNFHETLVVA